MIFHKSMAFTQSWFYRNFFIQSSIKYKFRTWISEWDLHSEFRSPVKMNGERWRLPPWKNLGFSRNFYCCETKFSVSEKFADFCVALDNFLVSVEISYCRSKVIIFLLYRNVFDPKIWQLICEYHVFCQFSSK